MKDQLKVKDNIVPEWVGKEPAEILKYSSTWDLFKGIAGCTKFIELAKAEFKRRIDNGHFRLREGYSGELLG